MFQFQPVLLKKQGTVHNIFLVPSPFHVTLSRRPRLAVVADQLEITSLRCGWRAAPTWGIDHLRACSPGRRLGLIEGIDHPHACGLDPGPAACL
eukprot:7549467-Pyramimonas_sp.AAC.1